MTEVDMTSLVVNVTCNTIGRDLIFVSEKNVEAFRTNLDGSSHHSMCELAFNESESKESYLGKLKDCIKSLSKQESLTPPKMIGVCLTVAEAFKDAPFLESYHIFASIAEFDRVINVENGRYSVLTDVKEQKPPVKPRAESVVPAVPPSQEPEGSESESDSDSDSDSDTEDTIKDTGFEFDSESSPVYVVMCDDVPIGYCGSEKDASDLMWALAKISYSPTEMTSIEIRGNDSLVVKGVVSRFFILTYERIVATISYHKVEGLWNPSRLVDQPVGPSASQ